MLLRCTAVSFIAGVVVVVVESGADAPARWQLSMLPSLSELDCTKWEGRNSVGEAGLESAPNLSGGFVSIQCERNAPVNSQVVYLFSVSISSAATFPGSAPF